jgi:heme-degrading monooxygenase HmoA
MVRHIVVYTLKEGINKPEAIEIIRSQLEPLVGVIPGLRHMEIRATFQGGMDYALYSEFESKEALINYKDHPAHLAAKKHFHHFLNTRVAADYEV